MVTASMLGIDAAAGNPPTLAITTTTRDHWIDNATIREGTAQFARKIRRDVAPNFQYAWMREWTTGRGTRAGGHRRTHKHWCGKGVTVEDAEAITSVAADVWGRLTGATEHRAQPVWDAGGLGRYVAGLVGHHLKESQAPPPGWKGRRFGTSKAYYTVPASELRARAETAVRDQRLVHRLEYELASEFEARDIIDATIFDEVLTVRYEAALRQPKPTVRQIPYRAWDELVYAK